jgi:hypothetical protein
MRVSVCARRVAMAEVMAAARVAVAGATAAVAAAHTRVLLCTFTAALRPKRLLEMYFYGSGADA